ncbi:MAG TPA: hypothetical protein VFE05_16505 [Longimicrobiaceae bacterium]|jgi:hypothetical protein|nr:hypothetical protein [Longimicrobiaceae bacterium]
MLKIKGSQATVATTSEVRRNLKTIFEEARTSRVFVTSDGELVGGIIGPEMMEILDEALADRELVEVSSRRLAEIRAGKQKLLDEDEFWAKAGL